MSLRRGAYGPETLSVLHEAFDEVWAAIAGNFGNHEDSLSGERSRPGKLTVSAVTAKWAEDGGTATALSKERDTRAPVLRSERQPRRRSSRPAPSKAASRHARAREVDNFRMVLR